MMWDKSCFALRSQQYFANVNQCPTSSGWVLGSDGSGRKHNEELNGCDESCYKAGEDIAGKLFAFVKDSKDEIAF